MGGMFMIIEQNTDYSAHSANEEHRHVEKNHAAAQEIPNTSVTTAVIDGVAYIVEHETAQTARETPLEKIRKLILRDAENFHKQGGKRAEMA